MSFCENDGASFPAKQALKKAAEVLGFFDCRIAKAQQAIHAQYFMNWLAKSSQGSMAWLAKNPSRRVDPREVLAGAKSVIVLGMSYFTENRRVAKEWEIHGKVASYALGHDYHKLIEEKLHDLDETLQIYGGVQKCYVDTGPVLERDFATLAGLGWNGKSAIQIHPEAGGYFFLATILSTLELTEDQPIANRCGSCERCILACPTQAIVAPHCVEATKCISYLTIESKNVIPVEFRKKIGDRLYGCDSCLEVCPWNRFAQISQEMAFFASHASFFQAPLRDLVSRFLAGSDSDFAEFFRHSPIKRLKRERFLRNACLVLGNSGNREDCAVLKLAQAIGGELVAEHAAWALARLTERGK